MSSYDGPELDGDPEDIAVEHAHADREVPEAAAPEAVEDVDLPPLRAALEAVLLITDEPVAAVTLAQVVERPTGEVEATLAELAAEYVAAGKGFELRQVAGGWRLYTRAEKLSICFRISQSART